MHARTGVVCVGRWVAYAFAFLATGGAATGQTCEPGWTEGFPNAPGFNGEVRAVAIFDDGNGPRLYAGGHFTTAGGQAASGIARWEGDHWAGGTGGVSPVSVGSPTGGNGVHWLGVLDDGSGPALYVGGEFTLAGGAPAHRVAKWDGRHWSAFGAGLNGTVRGMTVYDDGTGPAIYAVGLFTASGIVPMPGVAKWNGSSWEGLGSGLAGPPAYSVGYAYSIGVFDLGDGPKLYVGGRFSQAGGVYASSIAGWDGQQWSALGSGVYVSAISGPVMKLVLFDHGWGPQLTICGSFGLTPAQTPLARVARWTGSQWVQVGSDLSGNISHYANSFAVIPGPSGPVLHVGGWFAGATWLNEVNYAARLVNGDWKSVDGGMAGNFPDSPVRCLIAAEGPNGPEIWASGAFRTAGDAIANQVARWDGDRWDGVERGLGLTGPTASSQAGSGYAACTFDDGSGERLYVGGNFLGAGDRVCNSVGAWNGSEWAPLGGGVTSLSQTQTVPGFVYALHPYDDGSGEALYATGAFDQAGGGPCFNTARWDGQFWSAPGGSGLGGTGRALAVFDDGTGPALYVGGSFPSVGPIPAGSLARWNGSAWAAAGGTGISYSAGASINALAAFDDGVGGGGPALYAAGRFAQIGSITTPSIARWDGSAWSSVGGVTTLPTNVEPGYVHALCVYDDGGGPGLYAAGSFAGAASVPVHGNIARWRSGAWSALGTGLSLFPTGSVHALAVGDDGSGPAIYVGGQFASSFGGAQARSLVRWDGAAWSAVGAGVSITAPPPSGGVGQVLALAAADDGRSIFATGKFAYAGVVRSDGVGEWQGCACYADCDSDGVLTAADFGCFQTKFVAGDPWADCNQDSALAVNDFTCFQTRFAGGCP